MQAVEKILPEAKKAISEAPDLKSLESLRVAYLGKNGQITQLLKSLGTLSPEERPVFGQAVNSAKEAIAEALLTRKQSLEEVLGSQSSSDRSTDVTLPGRGMPLGHLHPITRTLERISDLFSRMGFEIAEGPEIEDDFYNFEALNIPPHHPARAMHDTFYFPDGKLLRTHTSPVQIRYMQNNKPPFRVIAPGRVYRMDMDITHTPMFHQVEGFMVDKNIQFIHLKGIIDQFVQLFFESSIKTRFRPSYFPFTEPSAEVDIQCVHCKGKGCRSCGQTGWLEILGCGMIHPKVLENCGINSEEYSGFAFGMGAERITMLRYGIPDIRLFFENDARFLDQF